jgi:hypothetical protein
MPTESSSNRTQVTGKPGMSVSAPMTRSHRASWRGPPSRLRG